MTCRLILLDVLWRVERGMLRHFAWIQQRTAATGMVMGACTGRLQP